METCILTFEDTRAINSDSDAFPHTDSLLGPALSSHSLYLKDTECLWCAGHDSKCKDGTVTKTYRVSSMEWGMRDGRGSRIIGNKQGNKLHNFRDKYNEEVKTRFSPHSAFLPAPTLSTLNSVFQQPPLPNPEEAISSFHGPTDPTCTLSCPFISFVYLSYLSQ